MSGGQGNCGKAKKRVGLFRQLLKSLLQLFFIEIIILEIRLIETCLVIFLLLLFLFFLLYYEY